MTFSSSTEVEEVFTHPSITLCITMDNNFTNGFANKEWLEAYKYEFPFPYPDLGNINDNFLSGYGKMKNLNDPSVLLKMNLKETDIWTPSIQGFLGEPARCFTYQPPAQR